MRTSIGALCAAVMLATGATVLLKAGAVVTAGAAGARVPAGSGGGERESTEFGDAGYSVAGGTIAGGDSDYSPRAMHRIVFSARDLDFSGRTRRGIASFYAARFGGRTMADGTPMHLGGDNAASMTLPLGTVARVTNLTTGRSALVTIRDRGPYVRGRILDLSPATARRIGLDRRAGLTEVAVKPVVLPERHGA
jgi:rare lipoprotein A